MALIWTFGDFSKAFDKEADSRRGLLDTDISESGHCVGKVWCPRCTEEVFARFTDDETLVCECGAEISLRCEDCNRLRCVCDPYCGEEDSNESNL